MVRSLRLMPITANLSALAQRECPVPIANKTIETETLISKGARPGTKSTSLLWVSQQKLHAIDEPVNITGNITRYAILNDRWQFSRCQGDNRHTYRHGLDDCQRQASVT